MPETYRRLPSQQTLYPSYTILETLIPLDEHLEPVAGFLSAIFLSL